MTDDEVHVSILQWLSGVTGLTVIKEKRGGNTPGLPYMMVNFITARKVRKHARKVKYEDTEGLNSESKKIVHATPLIEMEWQFSIHAYGPSPTSLFRPVLSRMEVSQAMEPAYPKLHVHEVSQVRNVPEFVRNTWQPRAQMDAFVRGIIQDTINTEIDVIEQHSFAISKAD